MNRLDELKNTYEIVLDVLEKYDPYNLADLCGKEEYDIEAVEIANRVNYDEKRLADWCKEVFKNWLYDNGTSDKKWLIIAKEIKTQV